MEYLTNLKEHSHLPGLNPMTNFARYASARKERISLFYFFAWIAMVLFAMARRLKNEAGVADNGISHTDCNKICTKVIFGCAYPLK
jgi:hypothetical protein